MNNYYGNGQPGGWQTPPQNNYSNSYGYANWYYAYNEQYQLEEKRQQEKKKIKKIGSLCGFAALLYVAISFGISIGLQILFMILPPLAGVFQETAVILAFDTITSVLSLGIPFLVIYFILKRKGAVEGLPYEKPADVKSSVFLTMLSIPTMILSSVAINFVSAIFQTMIGVEFTSNVGETNVATFPGIIMATLSIAVVPAVIEEFAVRGAIMQPLRKYGDKFAIILSALFFSLLHGNMFQIPYTFVGGLILGYLAVKTKSMWPPMILHFVNNGYSVIVMIISDLFGDDKGNLSAYIMWAAFIIIGVVGLVGYVVTRNKEHLSEGESVLKTGEKIKAFVQNIPMIIMIIVFGIMTLGSIVV